MVDHCATEVQAALTASATYGHWVRAVGDREESPVWIASFHDASLTLPAPPERWWRWLEKVSGSLGDQAGISAAWVMPCRKFPRRTPPSLSTTARPPAYCRLAPAPPRGRRPDW